MPHPAVLGAVLVGGLAILGYALYEQYKEQQSYEGYQQNYNRSRDDSRRNMFRHSNDFDFEDDSDNDEKQRGANKGSDRYTLRTENSQLRNRKPFPTEENNDVDHGRKSIDQDQYELTELESVIAERKRRLMAEQAFLDKEEENLRNRRQELMEQEKIFEKSTSSGVQGRKSASSSSDSGSDDERLDIFKSFVEQSQSSSFMENSDNNGSSSGENTAIFINKAETETTEETSSHDDSNSEHNQHLSSSNLQFPTASRTPSESEAAMSLSSRGVSDSEESWDVFSENEWADRHTDNEA